MFSRIRFPWPTLADIFVVAAFVWLLTASGQGSTGGLLQDGDTGVHIRTGLLILDSGRIPTGDPYSWTRPNAPWLAWEWLSDVLFALAYRAAGLGGVLVLSATVIAAMVAVLVRRVASRAGNALVALAVLAVLMSVAQMHLLARPHVFTLLFFALSLWLLDRYERNGTRSSVLILPLLTVLWVNLHGGVFALPATLAILGIGALAERRIETAKRLAGTMGLCLAATMANPFGYKLHLHVFEYLGAAWIRENIAEFRPLDLRSSEGLLLQVILAGSLLKVSADLRWWRCSRLLLILAWGHLALTSGRHAPLFVIVAAPIVAEGAGELWRAIAQSPLMAALDRIGSDYVPALTRQTIWAPLIAAVVVVGGLLPAIDDYPGGKYPVAMVREHAVELKQARLFTTDEWADYVIFRLHPETRVFLDGRTDFFGEQMVEDYKTLLACAPGWQKRLEGYGADAVLLPDNAPMTNALRASDAWLVLAQEDGATLLRRRTTPALTETASADTRHSR